MEKREDYFNNPRRETENAPSSINNTPSGSPSPKPTKFPLPPNHSFSFSDLPASMTQNSNQNQNDSLIREFNDDIVKLENEISQLGSRNQANSQSPIKTLDG